MLNLPYTKSGVGLLTIVFLTCLTQTGGPSELCIGQSGFWDRMSYVDTLL